MTLPDRHHFPAINREQPGHVYRYADGVSYHLALREHMACWPDGLTYDNKIRMNALREKLGKSRLATKVL